MRFIARFLMVMSLVLGYSTVSASPALAMGNCTGVASVKEGANLATGVGM